MNPADILRLAFTTLVGLLFGYLIGDFAIGLLLSTAAYLAWMHMRLFSLLKWIRNRKEYEPPETQGIFEDISLEIDYLRERHKKRKRNLPTT